MTPSLRPPLSRRTRQRNRRVEAHRPLVRAIAGHYAAHSPECRDDLEQVGALGLIRAAELYDRATAVPFSAYARRHIRGAILHYLRDTAPMVRPPRRLQERWQQLARCENELRLQLGRSPRAEELRQAMGLSALQWSNTQERGPAAERLWLAPELIDQLPAPESPQPLAPSVDLLGGMAALPARQRRVVEAVVIQGRSLRHVAAEMGSSAATVHRQLHAALAALRIRLESASDVPAC